MPLLYLNGINQLPNPFTNHIQFSANAHSCESINTFLSKLTFAFKGVRSIPLQKLEFLILLFLYLLDRLVLFPLKRFVQLESVDLI